MDKVVLLVENYVNNCATCQKCQPQEPETPLNLWTTLERRWLRVHTGIDFTTGPFEEKMWLVIIDAFSN